MVHSGNAGLHIPFPGQFEYPGRGHDDAGVDSQPADEVQLEALLALGSVVVGDVAPGTRHASHGGRHHRP